MWAALGLMIGLITVLVPLYWLRAAQQVPPIHDITTDVEHPPRFLAVLPLRNDAPNSAEYGGREIALQQAKAYPEIAPALLDVTPEQAYQRALAVARKMGWNIVYENPAEGRIEATDTTRWFGFKDDVVVRITLAGQGSRVDIRSASRVGLSDAGANARRIEAFLKRLGDYGNPV